MSVPRRALTPLLRRLGADRRGNIALMTALALLPLIAAVGVAIDSALAYTIKTRMQAALDSAGLAAARILYDEGHVTRARQFFDANFPPGWMDSTVTGFSVGANEDDGLLTLNATASVPTAFMKLFGHNNMLVSARTVIERENRGMELALVMDNTGSMRSGGKITAMKDAAHELVDILYGPNESIPYVWMSLVPYAATVNVGPDNWDWLAADDRYFDTPSPFLPTTWKGCVEGQPAPYDEDDTLPSEVPLTTFFYAPDVDNVWPVVNEANSAQNNGTGPNLGCPPAITPLVAEKSAVHDAISEMQPWHRGGTLANIGLTWGWRTISPRWRGLWTEAAQSDLPLDYHYPLVDKIVIILTDGTNEVYDWPDHKPDKGVGPRGSDYTAYGRAHDAGFSNATKMREDMDKRFARTCTAMKAEGIRIYSITFGSAPDKAAQTLFRNCASQPEYYHHAPTNAQLAAAFRSIGEQLSALRIVE